MGKRGRDEENRRGANNTGPGAPDTSTAKGLIEQARAAEDHAQAALLVALAARELRGRCGLEADAVKALVACWNAEQLKQIPEAVLQRGVGAGVMAAEQDPKMVNAVRGIAGNGSPIFGTWTLADEALLKPVPKPPAFTLPDLPERFPWPAEIVKEREALQAQAQAVASAIHNDAADEAQFIKMMGKGFGSMGELHDFGLNRQDVRRVLLCERIALADATRAFLLKRAEAARALLPELQAAHLEAIEKMAQHYIDSECNAAVEFQKRAGFSDPREIARANARLLPKIRELEDRVALINELGQPGHDARELADLDAQKQKWTAELQALARRIAGTG